MWGLNSWKCSSGQLNVQKKVYENFSMAVIFKGFLISCQLAENSSSFLPGDFPMFINPLIPPPPVHKYRNTNTEIQQYKNPLIQPLDTLTKTAAHLPPMAFNCVCNCINIHKYRYTVVCTRSLISHTIAESEWKVEDSCLDCFPQLARDAGGGDRRGSLEGQWNRQLRKSAGLSGTR